MADFRSSFVFPPNGGCAYRLWLQVTAAAHNATDISLNRSRLSWWLRLEKDRSWDGFYAYGSAGRSVVLDGSSRLSGSASVPDAPWPGTQTWLLGSGSHNVTHNADGKKTISVSASYTRTASGWAPGSMSTSGNMTLVDIPRTAAQHYDGSSWDNQMVEAYDGSSWKLQIVEHWNGTAWVRQQ